MEEDAFLPQITVEQARDLIERSSDGFSMAVELPPEDPVQEMIDDFHVNIYLQVPNLWSSRERPVSHFLLEQDRTVLGPEHGEILTFAEETTNKMRRACHALIQSVVLDKFFRRLFHALISRRAKKEFSARLSVGNWCTSAFHHVTSDHALVTGEFYKVALERVLPESDDPLGPWLARVKLEALEQMYMDELAEIEARFGIKE